MVSCARATRGLGRPSLDTRSGRPSSPPSRGREERWSLDARRGEIHQVLPAWPVSLVPHVSHISRRGPWTHAVGDHLAGPQGGKIGRAYLRIDQAVL